MYKLPEKGYVRLRQFLPLIGIGKSTWWKGVKDGRFPKPTKLGPRITVWRAEDIHRLIETGCLKEF